VAIATGCPHPQRGTGVEVGQLDEVPSVAQVSGSASRHVPIAAVTPVTEYGKQLECLDRGVLELCQVL
jgi:hypothetical protein